MNLNTIEDIFNEAIRLSIKADRLKPETQTIENMLLKLGEEYGEICTDILKLKQYKVNNENPGHVFENAREEAVDMLLMVINIMNKLGMDTGMIVAIATEKLHKWDTKHLEANGQ